MRTKTIQNRILSILLTLSFLIVLPVAGLAAETPYSTINNDISNTWTALQSGPLALVFADKQTITTGMYLWQSEMITTGSGEMISFAAITTDTAIAVPYLEVVLNPDKYDPGYELAKYAQEYFNTIVPGIDVKKPILEMMGLAVEAVDIRFMGYDGAQYISTKVNGINLSVNIVKTSGDTYTVMAYLNLPDTALDNDKSFTTQTLTERLKYENLRQIDKWFVYNELKTDAIKITDEKWEVSWEVMSAIPGTSTYELNVLDSNDKVVKSITINLESNSMGTVILEGKGEYKLQAKVKSGNMYVYAKRIPDSK